MKKLFLTLAMTAACLTTLDLHAADAKKYQVTGPVLEVNPTFIVVQKGDEKWQINCDAATLGKAKVGDKVTVYYTVTASKVEVKADKK